MLRPACFGQGGLGADYTVASRLLQFFCSLPKVVVNRTPDKLCHRSACLVGQYLELLELVFLQEEGCPLHDHTIPYRHTCGNRMEVPNFEKEDESRLDL
jgi:hypothetical protein